MADLVRETVIREPGAGDDLEGFVGVRLCDMTEPEIGQIMRESARPPQYGSDDVRGVRREAFQGPAGGGGQMIGTCGGATSGAGDKLLLLTACMN